MKNTVSLRCCLHGTVDELPVFFERLQAWANASNVPLDLILKLSLMLDELLANIATHAYAGKGGPICVDVQLLSPYSVQSVIRDHGPAFDPTRMPAPDTQQPMSERKIGGLGVHFVRKLASRFSYRRDGNCNEVTLVHSLPSKD